ncbi:hypothetical protein AB0E63_46435 [Kribbella sp. NPDC026596]|uniref:hypothetical protein n=1 Tax=Kribbella sp. NPDC026596 TaxID=3155122 RepID=UPI003408F59A
MGEEFLGVAGVGDDADGFRAAHLNPAGVAEDLQGVGNGRDGGIVASDRTGGGRDVHRSRAVVVRPAHKHAMLARLLLSLGTGGGGIGMHLRGGDDLVQPVRRQRVDDRRDPLIDIAGGLLGQLRTLRHDPTRLPWRRLTGPDAGPGEREPVPQRQRVTYEVGRYTRRDALHNTELGHRELRNRRAPRTTQHDRSFPAVTRAATRTSSAGVGMVAVGIDQGVFEEPRVAAPGLGAVLGGRLQQVGRRQRRQVSFEHVSCISA